MIVERNNEKYNVPTEIEISKFQRNNRILIPIISILIACFYPTSINGVISNTENIILYYIISSFVVGILFLANKNDKKLLFVLIALVGYLEISTLYCNSITGASFSIARFAPLFICFILFTLQVEAKASFRILNLVLEIVTIIIIIWNIGIMFKLQPIMDYTVNNYSQFVFYTVNSMIELGKPIFTFGVHTFAAYYYMIIFYLWYVTIKKEEKPCIRYYFYLVALNLLTVMLKSSTPLIFSIIMIVLIIKVQKNTVAKMLMVLGSIAIMLFLLDSELYQIYHGRVTSDANGIIPRYLAQDNIFTDNFRIMKQVILGIGYTIPRDYAITYTDSGYIVYFTMGNIVLPIGLYYMFYKFLNNNIKKYAKSLFLFTLLFELAIPSLIYLKTAFFLIFSVYYLRSLDENVKMKNREISYLNGE